MTNVNIMIDKATNKTLMAAALLAMAFDNAEIKDNGCSGYFPYEAIITENTLEFDESIKSTRKSMVRMGPAPKPSCIGLVWKHFGLQILNKLECIPEYQEIVWRRIDREFITTLDSCSSETFELVDCPSLNPEDKMLEEDYLKYLQAQILKLIDFLSSNIAAGILEYGTECYVQALLNEKGDKNYIEIDNGFIPWRKKVEEYNRFSQEGHPVKFVIYPLDGEFVAETVYKYLTEYSNVQAFLLHSDIDKERLIATFHECLNSIK